MAKNTATLETIEVEKQRKPRDNRPVSVKLAEALAAAKAKEAERASKREAKLDAAVEAAEAAVAKAQTRLVNALAARDANAAALNVIAED